MIRHHSPSIFRRPAREWAARGALAAGFAILAFQMVTASLAHAVSRVDPQRAALIAPRDGIILGKAAEAEFRTRPDFDVNSSSARLAREAIMAEAAAADAVTVLGFQAQLRGEQVKSDQLFSYVTKLTRRELQSRIWAIEKAVGRGDIDLALRNYDIALRTSDDAKRMLFPILAMATVEPLVRRKLLPILAARPTWEKDFFAFAATRAIEPEGIVALISEGRRDGLRVEDGLRAHIVDALISQDKPKQAWAYYRTFRPGADVTRSRDPTFALKADGRAAFDWRAGDDPSLSVSMTGNGGSGVLDFAVPPSKGGIVVRQTQMLPAGLYRLEGRSIGLDQPERSRPYWLLSCHDGQDLGRVTLPNSHHNRGRFTGEFTVPAACPVQVLALVVRPSDAMSGVSGQIDHAQLVPES